MSKQEIKDLATEDIRQELRKQGKAFIVFIERLDEAIDKIVENHIRQQEERSHDKGTNQ